VYWFALRKENVFVLICNRHCEVLLLICRKRM